MGERTAEKELYSNKAAGFPRLPGVALSKKIILQYTSDGRDSVLPADLLTFLVGSAGVGNAYFVDSCVQPGNFGGNLQFKAKTIFLDGYLFQDFTPEYLVTGLHIAQVQVGQ